MADTPTQSQSSSPLPDWYPGWARDLADLYFSGTICTFVLHGNVHDIVRCPLPSSDRPASDRTANDRSAANESYVSLSDFLATSLFGNWDLVLGYDLGRGLRAIAGSDPKRLQAMMQYVSGVWGAPNTWSREPDKTMDQLDLLIQRSLLLEDSATRKRTAFLFEHAEYLLPAGDLASLARGQASRMVRMMSWSANPYIKRLNMAFCLITEKLSELSDRFVNNPHVATLEIPLPQADDRKRFVEASRKNPVVVEARTPMGPAAESAANAAAGAASAATVQPAVTMSVDALTQSSSGLNLANLNVVLAQSGVRGIDPSHFRKLKKRLIERQCQGLVEFVEPAHTLDLVVGTPQAKSRLEQDAKWLIEGRTETAPMGYLFCGSVGTGKTFLAECYAGSVGIPCVKLRNFRSKYVGETEGNLEQVLNVLRSLGPVVVIIDEADASLGDRRADGDSGTSGRVFSMIASQMGDTRYRGKIVWMLLTCRPDLLPIDLKRQGRCEVHIPLFAPQSSEEIAAMFRAMARKNKLKLADDAIPEVSLDRQLSGADLESVLLAARRRTLESGHEIVTRNDLEAALEEFIPSAEGLEKELQEIAAVLECTDRSFLPSKWREKLANRDARAKLQERLVAIRQLLEE